MPHVSGFGGYPGGFGGWGGGFGLGGIGAVGLVGLTDLFRHRGHDGHDGRRRDDCCEKILDMHNDNVEARFNALEAKGNTHEILGAIAANGIKADTAKDFMFNAFAGLSKDVALQGKDTVISEKNVLSAIAECCCVTQKAIAENTCKVLSRIDALETANLRDEIAELRAYRNSRSVIDNFNFRVGSQFVNGNNTTSNNSGQINAPV